MVRTKRKPDKPRQINNANVLEGTYKLIIETKDSLRGVVSQPSNGDALDAIVKELKELRKNQKSTN